MADFLFGAGAHLILFADLLADAAAPFRSLRAQLARRLRTRRIDALLPREIA